MPRPRPLPPGKAAHTLAHRLGAKLAPKMWQLNTNFGIRPYRVFLVWSMWTGGENGEGNEVILLRKELLPTPKIDISGIRFEGSHVGRLPAGTVNIAEVAVTYTSDELTGVAYPGPPGDEPTDFYYEVVEDDRGVPMPQRPKFRLSGAPMLDAQNTMWRFTLERSTESNEPNGASPFEE